MSQEGSEDFGLALGRLTLSDPAVRTNMLRHVAAIRLLLTGRVDDEASMGIAVASGFGINEAAEARLAALTRADGTDRLWVNFDVDDGLGRPTGLGLFHLDGVDGTVVFYDRCRLCAPADGGPTYIVFSHHGETGLFAYRRRRLERSKVKPTPAVCRTGIVRADDRLRRSVASRRVLDRVPEEHMREFPKEP